MAAESGLPNIFGTREPVTESFASVFGNALRVRLRVPAEMGVGYVDQFTFPEAFSGGYCDFRVQRDVAEGISGENLLKFHFKLSGCNTLRFANGDEQTIEGGHMSVLIHPEGLDKLDCHSVGAHERSVTFLCRPDFLRQTLGLDPDILPEPVKSYALGREPRFYLRTFPMPAAVRCDLQTMLALPPDARFGHLRVQACCLDLMAAMLEVMSGEGDTPRSTRLSPRDIRALEEVRAFLETGFAEAPTLATLARRAGLNRNKLTQGFRELFDESVQDFAQRVRMQHARTLLESGMPVGEVALQVGYLHQSSFAQAFSAYFGLPPRELRRTRRIGATSLPS